MNPNKCSFWYIHSFVLDGLSFQELVNRIKANTDEKVLEKNSSHDVYSQNNSPILEEIASVQGSFSPYVRFEFDEIICKDISEPKTGWPVLITYRENAPQIRGTVKRRFYFTLTGLCSHILELCIEPNELLSYGEIEHLIRLSNIFEESGARIKLLNSGYWHKSDQLCIDKREYPSSIFRNDVRRLVCFLNEGLKDSIDKVSWLDDPKVSSSVLHHRLQEQTPYVVSILGYNDPSCYCTIVAKALELKASEKEGDDAKEAHKLAALLYRFKTPEQSHKVDLSYIKAFSSRKVIGFENYHLHEDIFVTIHLRSVFVAFNESENKTRNNHALTKIFMPALKVTLANARANWFGLVLINSYIDDYMQELREKNDTKPSEVLRRILWLRIRIMGLLDSTVSHKRASGSLSELYKEYYRLFAVNELRQDALVKIELLEKVYFNMQQFSFWNTTAKEIDDLNQ